MKSKKTALYFCLRLIGISGCAFLSVRGYAADFSQAQKIFVPPTLIHRDLDALGTNSWNIPASTAATTSAGSSSSNPIDALISSFGAAGSTSTAATSASADASGLDFGTALNTAQYIPGVSKIANQVNTLMSNGKVAEAENLTRAGLKYFPGSAALKSKFTSITSSEAQVFLAGNYTDLAGKKAREALACNPNAKTAKVVEGKVLQAQGLNPNTAEGHVQAGDGLSSDGRLLEAGVEYKLALSIKPTADAHIGLGNLALGKGSVVDAGRHYQQALALDPNSAAAYRQRGALNYVMKDAVGANSDFSKAVTLAPDDQLSSEALVGLWKQQVANSPGVNSHLGLARAYLQTNNLDAAKSEYKTVASLDPNNPALPEARRSFMSAVSKQQASQSVQAAKTLEGQGAYNEAQQKVNEALALSPTDPQILLYNGQLSQKMGQYQQAREHYMAVLKVDPKNVEAARNLKMLGSPLSQTSNGTASTTMPVNAMGSTNQAPPPALLRLIRPSSLTPSSNAAPAAGSFAPPSNFQSPSNFPPPGNFPPANNPAFMNNPVINSPLINPGNNDIQNVPLKSPLQPKSQLAPMPSGNEVCDNSYLRTEENVYLQPHPPINYIGESDADFSIVDSSEVNSLSNFAYALRLLMAVQKQVLQLSSTSKSNM